MWSFLHPIPVHIGFRITVLMIALILITFLIDNWFCYKKLDFDYFKSELSKGKNSQAYGFGNLNIICSNNGYDVLLDFSCFLNREE